MCCQICGIVSFQYNINLWLNHVRDDNWFCEAGRGARKEVFDYLFASLSIPCNLFSWFYQHKFFIFALLFKKNHTVHFTCANFYYCFYSIFKRYCFCLHIIPFILIRFCWGRSCMVVGFTTTCAISAYQHKRCEFEPHSWWGVLDTTLCGKVCQWLATGLWFSPGTPISSTNKTDRHDITKILLKVASKINRWFIKNGFAKQYSNIIKLFQRKSFWCRINVYILLKEYCNTHLV